MKHSRTLNRRYGKRTNPEASEVDDNLFGEINKVGMKRNRFLLRIEQVEKSQQKKFIGLKKDDTVEFEVEKILERFSSYFSVIERY